MSRVLLKFIIFFLLVIFEVRAKNHGRLLLQGTTPPPGTPPKSPCEADCVTKCSKEEHSSFNFCYRICSQRCMNIPEDLLYECATTCAESIPKIFTSDLQKRESYGNACYKYCIKNALAYTTDDDDYGDTI
ncbi:hypothetical protein COLO4_30347 [Corchorus olitorius]|uniref:Uncharacterized protein n=1 Tax=Corchorus olitorius TaxID=93759 RepID=A0A1R3H954_9ROSI|nr:hypothetical protein COLO4_30347 [Corchorus olitorius]